MNELSERQVKILNFINLEVQQKGYPPSVREIGEAVGLSSSSTVHAHLAKLEKLGYIRRDQTKPRAIEVLYNNPSEGHASFNSNHPTETTMINVPILGTVTAGNPILAEQNIEDYLPLSLDFTRSENVFILKVRGDSMLNAGIWNGDLVLVNNQASVLNGDIVVALLEEEATVKRFYKEKDRVRLQPENDFYQPIYSQNVQILGKVVSLIRRY